MPNGAGTRKKKQMKPFKVVVKEDADYVAYTPRPLPMHMDYVYYENPPALAILHCIRNDDCVEGGDGILQDTHSILEEFRTKHPQHYATLVRVPATFFDYHEGSNPKDMKHKKHHIVLDEDGQVEIFRWNATAEGMLDVPQEDVVPFYEAYTCLGRMIEESEKIYFKYMPGDVITMDNWRMLHGRTPIKLNGGIRHLAGASVIMDEYRSKFRVLCQKLGHEYVR